MRIVIAPDKFKGSLSAIEAAQAMGRGASAAWPEALLDLVPMADGGEGTVEALVAATGGSYREARVTGPLGETRQARYGLLGDGKTAVIEMAAASGLVLVPARERDPLKTTTRGTGELVRDALDAGVRRLVIGIGGSATNDGGAGLAQALGYRLLDADGNELSPGGGALEALERIDGSQRDGRLGGVTVHVACDVENPLCGPQGASAIYGPQKGATPKMVKQLDANLARLAVIIERDLKKHVRDLPGAGAAGGLGAGLVAFAGGRLQRGVDLVIDAVRLRQRLAGATLCLTGEGSLDGSSAFGKTAVGVARAGATLGCPVIALAGTLGEGCSAVLEHGVQAYLSICPGPVTLEQAMRYASSYLEATAEQAVRVFRAAYPTDQALWEAET